MYLRRGKTPRLLQSLAVGEPERGQMTDTKFVAESVKGKGQNRLAGREVVNVAYQLGR